MVDRSVFRSVGRSVCRSVVSRSFDRSVGRLVSLSLGRSVSLSVSRSFYRSGCQSVRWTISARLKRQTCCHLATDYLPSCNFTSTFVVGIIYKNDTSHASRSAARWRRARCITICRQVAPRAVHHGLSPGGAARITYRPSACRRAGRRNRLESEYRDVNTKSSQLIDDEFMRKFAVTL